MPQRADKCEDTVNDDLSFARVSCDCDKCDDGVLEQLPLILTCQGRSNLAQLANDLALIMDHEGLAELGSSCRLPLLPVSELDSLSKKRRFLVLEGCRKACVQALLAKLRIPTNECVVLSDLGIPLKTGESCTYSQMNMALRAVQQRLVELGAR